MEIIVACPKCQNELRLPSREYLGRRGKCPKCEHKFEMQEKLAAPAPPPQPEAAPLKPQAEVIIPQPAAQPVPPPEKRSSQDISPVKVPGIKRGDSVPVPAPVDEEFKKLRDPDFSEDDDDSVDMNDSDSALVPAGIWDDIETVSGPAPQGPVSSFQRSGVFEVQARCSHCHGGVEFQRDDDLRDCLCPRCHARFSLIHPESPAEALTMPHQVGTYVLQKFPRIGLGPFGNVYRAKDGQSQNYIVIKVSRGDQVSEAERAKFLTKLRMLKDLRNPSIATLHEVEAVEDRVYLVSTYVSGIDLSEYLLGVPERQLSIRSSALLCAQIASLLHHAHRFYMIHGNLKPSNIKLDADLKPFLFDFGLNQREKIVQMTGNGRIVGTAAYLAPEQLPGSQREPDAQTDVFALGVILYELVTGHRPFPGEGPDLLKQIAKGSPTPPRAINSDVPKPLETIILKCLEVDPRDRYQSANDVRKELMLFWEDKPIQTPNPGLLTQFSRWCRRRWILAGLLLTFLVLTILGASFVGWRLWQTGGVF